MADQNEHPLGTKENPCTIANSTPEERRYKYCLCEACGEVKRCVPGSDFFITHPDKIFRCETCFTLYLSEEHDIDNIVVLKYSPSNSAETSDDSSEPSDDEPDETSDDSSEPSDDEPDPNPEGSS